MVCSGGSTSSVSDTIRKLILSGSFPQLVACGLPSAEHLEDTKGSTNSQPSLRDQIEVSPIFSARLKLFALRLPVAGGWDVEGIDNIPFAFGFGETKTLTR
jgi:hypothetical protein